MKFLVVDDSSTMRRIIKNSLKRIGYNDVVEAENGKEALSQVGQVDIIMTAMHMPKMGGLQFVKKVREQNSTIPILMVTTSASKEDIVQALKNGVNNYIIKPFTPDTLKEKLERVLNG